jgi:hypothetical protein
MFYSLLCPRIPEVITPPPQCSMLSVLRIPFFTVLTWVLIFYLHILSLDLTHLNFCPFFFVTLEKNGQKKQCSPHKRLLIHSCRPHSSTLLAMSFSILVYQFSIVSSRATLIDLLILFVPVYYVSCLFILSICFASCCAPLPTSICIIPS